VVLHLAREMGLLKVGTVSVDGTHIKANASKHKSVRYDRAGDLEQKLRQDIKELLAQAEKTDSEGAADEQKLPREIAGREVLLEKVRIQWDLTCLAYNIRRMWRLAEARKVPVKVPARRGTTRLDTR
jgi:hypothetical protein